MGFRGRRPLRRLSRGFQHFPDGRWEQGGRIQGKSDKNETRRAEKSNPQQMFEEWLDYRPDMLKKSGLFYLTIIPRPTSNTWYSKTRMGQHRIGQIMKSVGSCLPPESNKKITNHSMRKTIVAKLKNAGQPCHKILQVTGHAQESSLDDYDENCLKSLADTCLHNPAQHLRFLQHPL